MRTVKKEVSAVDINALTTGDEIVIDVTITTDDLTSTKYPRALRIENSSGAKLGYIIQQNTDEEKERVTKPEWYAPIPLEASLSDLSLTVHCEKFIVVQLDDTTVATGDLTLYFTNFQDF